MRYLVLVALVACSPRAEDPKPLPPTDGGAPLSVDECGIACWQLRRAGCHEGRPYACERTCLDMIEAEIPPPFACIAQAGNVDAIRACGLRCLP